MLGGIAIFSKSEDMQCGATTNNTLYKSCLRRTHMNTPETYDTKVGFIVLLL